MGFVHYVQHVQSGQERGRGLNPGQARRVYDRIGRMQDWQSFYESPAVEQMVRHAELGRARAVFEFGCGTGRLGAELLAQHLHPSATYTGVDISPVMVSLAQETLNTWEDRATVQMSGEQPRIDAADRSFDRFLSLYVFDLLAQEYALAIVREAARVLEPGGLLCLVSLTWGDSVLSRGLSRLWEGLWSVNPKMVGGCRPVELFSFVEPAQWRTRHRSYISAWGLTSQTAVLERR